MSNAKLKLISKQKFNKNYSSTLKPLSQKKTLTCGIFSVVNSFRLILNKSETEWKTFKHSIIQFIKKRYRLYDKGLYPYHIELILSHTRMYVKKVWNINMTYTKLPKKLPNEFFHPTKYSKEIIKFLRKKNTTIITGITGTLNHWSVIRKIDRNKIYLYDSTGFKYLLHDKCIHSNPSYNHKDLKIQSYFGIILK